MNRKLQRQPSTPLNDAFRELRAEWFRFTSICAPEFDQKKVKTLYDSHTERIIAGERLPVAPECWDDMQTEQIGWYWLNCGHTGTIIDNVDSRRGLACH